MLANGNSCAILSISIAIISATSILKKKKKLVPNRVNCLHSNLTFTTARFQQYSLTVLVVAVLFACHYQDTQKHPFLLVLRNGTSFPLK